MNMPAGDPHKMPPPPTPPSPPMNDGNMASINEVTALVDG